MPPHSAHSRFCRRNSGEELEKDCLSYCASAEILLKKQEDVQERSSVAAEEVQPEELACRMEL